MGNMHVIPTEADLRTADEKCEPLHDFVPIDEHSPLWEHGAKFCNGCCEPFDLVFVRKHHCRICGLAYCTRCSPKRYVLNQSRGCGKCTSKIILEMKDRMLAEHVKAIAAAQELTHAHQHPNNNLGHSGDHHSATHGEKRQLAPHTPSNPRADTPTDLHRVESMASDVSVQSPVHRDKHPADESHGE